MKINKVFFNSKDASRYKELVWGSGCADIDVTITQRHNMDGGGNGKIIYVEKK